MREVVAVPGHPALRALKYEPLIGGEAERPCRREVGFNETYVTSKPSSYTKAHLKTGARVGMDTHGGTSHLNAQQVDDLVNFLESIE